METETIIKIRGYHIDHFGHVNHARYIEFLEEARWAYMDTRNLIELFHRTVEPSPAFISGWPELAACLKKGGVKNEG